MCYVQYVKVMTDRLMYLMVNESLVHGEHQQHSGCLISGVIRFDKIFLSVTFCVF